MSHSDKESATGADIEKHHDEEHVPGGIVRAHSIDPEAERRLVRKMDTHIIPLVMGLYLLSFLDRSNIGNAEIAGMQDDLNLSSSQYEWLLTIFYISYIVFEFNVIMWKVVQPHIWATCIVLGWGIVSTCQAAVQNWSGMMALRFLLGMFETGFGPGIPYLLSFFYLRHELGFRCGIFLSAAPLASTFAGALAYGITSGHPSFPSWRLLFLVEGLPTIAAAPLAYFFLPDAPEKARFLTPDEKRIAKARGVRQTGEGARIGSIDFKDVFSALLDLKAWLTALMYFSVNVSFSSLPVFLPTILEELGFTSINAQGLSAPPYFLSFLITCGSSWIADRTQQRGLMIAFLTIIGGVGYIILATTESVGARYFAIYLVASGVFPAIANLLPYTLNNQGTDTRRGTAMALLQMVGQCGPLLGTRLYPESDQPRYIKGHSVCAAFLFFTTILVLILRTLLVWENRKLDRKYGPVAPAGAAPTVVNPTSETAGGEKTAGAEEATDGTVAVENYGPNFRYVL